MIPIVLTSGTAAQALAPTPVFAPYVSYDVGRGHSVAVADFTGDGRNDVVLTTEDHDAYHNPDNDHLWLFAQGPGGAFSAPQPLPLALGWMPQGSVAAGDLDGDGRTDAVVATGYSLQPYLQLAGTLLPGPPITLDGVQQVQVTDVNGDGRSDLVTNGTGGVAILGGTGSGSFSAPTLVTPTGQVDMGVSDVTGDGRPDIVGCGYPALVMVHAQQADGTFADAVTQAGDFTCSALSIADLTGDGRQDVAIAGGGNSPRSRIGVLAQTPGGTLAPAATYRTYDIPGPVATGDMNGDGFVDLVVDHANWTMAGVHAQAPDHSLDPERRFRLPTANGAAAAGMDLGDVDGEGHPDIVIADDLNGLVVLSGREATPSTTTSTVLLPTTTPTTVIPGAPPKLFADGQAYEGNDGDSATTGDFNGDGRTDVAVTTNFSWDRANYYKLILYLQGADGSLERSVAFDTDGDGSDVMVVAAGDLDGDGRIDLVVRMREGIDVFMQRQDGFADRKYIEMPYAARVDIADIDADGKADLVMTGLGVSVYRSLGAYTFAPPVTATTDYHSQMAIGDVTGDGRLDLVTTNPYARQAAAVVLGQAADGTFNPPVEYRTGGYSMGTLTVGDLTGDGRVDVAVTDTLGDYPSFPRVKVLAQTASGTLAAPTTYPSDEPRFLHAADVNGDGRTDLITTGGSARTQVGALLQQADGTLGAEQVTAVMYSTSPIGLVPVAVGDISGDGRPDVVIADANTGLVVVRNGTTPRPPPANVAIEATYSLWAGRAGTPALDGIGTWVVPLNVPAATAGQDPPTYVYGHHIGFSGSSATGVAALLSLPSGRFAFFTAVEPNGTPHSVAVPFNWSANRFYFLFVYQVAPGTWGAWVYDYTAASWVTIGALSLPPEWGKLSSWSTTTAWWAGSRATRCSLYPAADVLFAPPTGFVGSTATQAAPANSGVAGGGCPSEVSAWGDWVRYRLGAAHA